MAVERLTSPTSFPTRAAPERTRPEFTEAWSNPGARQSTRGNRSRYRVDEAYRTYENNRNQRRPSRPDAGAGQLRKVTSAELLSSMIHRMGGGVTSSAKGVFVDITV